MLSLCLPLSLPNFQVRQLLDFKVLCCAVLCALNLCAYIYLIRLRTGNKACGENMDKGFRVLPLCVHIWKHEK